MKEYQFDNNIRKTLESLAVPFVIYQYVDDRVVALLASDGFCNLIHMTREEAVELMNTDMYKGTHPEDRQRVSNLSNTFARDGGAYDVVYRVWSVFHEEYRIIHAQGRQFEASDGTPLSIIQYMDESVHADQARVSTFNFHEASPRDLETEYSELLIHELRVREDYYDHLTGLPNIGYFLKLAETSRVIIKERGGTTAILAFDFTGMKQFNGIYGLEEGDRLMRSFADVLRRHFGNEDCARFGEDHFAVCTEADNIENTLNTIFEEMKSANGGRNLPVRAGIYLDTFDRADISVCCDRAKIACDQDRTAFESKFVYYDQKMMYEDLSRTYVLNNFERALKKKWIKVFYQPIIRAATGKICNEEALARWIDPERGVIKPNEFVPILEEAKAIYKLDLYMVERILEDLKLKKEAGVPLVPVTINLSRYDFQYCDIVSEIDLRVREAGIDPSLLIIELTESVTGHDQDYIRLQMRRLHRAGFKVWMDDFGSGYSSLNNLQDFDFDLIKLDMQFMTGFDRGRKNTVILTKVIEMAMELGMDTLVEGVENEDQYRFLKKVGCDKLQGYQFGKAAPLGAIIEMDRVRYGLEYESAGETDYLDKISMVSLEEPFYRESGGVGRFYEGTGVAILEGTEYGKIRLLRCNSIYYNMITRIYNIDLRDGTMRIKGDAGNAVTKSISATIERSVGSGKWETTGNLPVGPGIFINVNVRRYGRNPVTEVPSMLLVMSSVRPEKNAPEGGSQGGPAPKQFRLKEVSGDGASDYYRDLPVAYLVARLVRDETGAPVDLEILFANERFSRLAGITNSTLIGAMYSDLVNVYEGNWLSRADEVLSTGLIITDTRFTRSSRRPLSYTIRPSSVPDCCSFTFYPELTEV